MNHPLVARIRDAGIVGAGGAGFPTHVKAASQVGILIANGAECEPILITDKIIMMLHAAEVVDGLCLMREATGASRCVFATKRAYNNIVEIMIPLLERAGVELHLLDDYYPVGDEHVLTHEITRRVVPEGGIPPDVGVVVSNVGTLRNVFNAWNGLSLTHTYVTVAGAVKTPGVYNVPIGTLYGDLLRMAGGVTTDGFAMIEGGPMMGILTCDTDKPVVKTSGGLIILPSGHPYVQCRRADFHVQRRLARSVCCQCNACTDMCPRALLGHDLKPHMAMRAIQHFQPGELPADMISQSALCSLCGVCESYACTMQLSPRKVFQEFKARLATRPANKGSHGHDTDLHGERRSLKPRPAQKFTRIPKKRLMIRLGLGDYDFHPDEWPVFNTEKTSADFTDSGLKLMLKQHVGQDAVPVVREGDFVKEGQLVAEIPEGALGARVHASVDGHVTGVTGNHVRLRRSL